MPELRKDPVLGRWIIISKERSKRPTDFIVEEPKLVEELLLAAAAQVRGLRSVPKPYVMYPSLNSHDVTYQLCVHALIGEVPDRIRSDLNRAVLQAFNKAGVQIMTPFYTVDPESKKVPKLADEKPEVPT